MFITLLPKPLEPFSYFGGPLTLTMAQTIEKVTLVSRSVHKSHLTLTMRQIVLTVLTLILSVLRIIKLIVASEPKGIGLLVVILDKSWILRGMGTILSVLKLKILWLSHIKVINFQNLYIKIKFLI